MLYSTVISVLRKIDVAAMSYTDWICKMFC